MEFCNTLCCLCMETGHVPISLTRYHKVCIGHIQFLVNQSVIQCLHCESKIIPVQNTLICMQCFANPLKYSFKCSHSLCENCVRSCQRCRSLICSFCNAYTEICQACVEAENALKICRFCKMRPVIEIGGEICRECIMKICTNCGNFSEVKIRLECSHDGCLFCEGNLICKECQICEKCPKLREICRSCGVIECGCQKKNYSCTNCVNKAKLWQSTEEHCQITENILIFSENINTVVPSISCNFCYKNPQVFRFKCGHFSCEKCLNRSKTCKICQEIPNCSTCKRSSSSLEYLNCGHTLCGPCKTKNPSCQVCKCSCCSLQTTNLSQKSTTCKHVLCPECCSFQNSQQKCIICWGTYCKNCQKIRGPEKKLQCGHVGCRNCEEKGICNKCIFNSKKYDKQFKINDHNSCIRCLKHSNLILFCKDWICVDCKNEVKMENFNYSCVNCCLNSKIVCLECKRESEWRIDGNILKKLCCNEEYCPSCLKRLRFRASSHSCDKKL